MNTGYGYASGALRPIGGDSGMVGGVVVGEVFRPSQTSIATYSLAPGECQDFNTGFGTQNVCNFGMRGAAPQNMNVYVKKMPTWVYEAGNLFRSRGGNASRPEDYTPEEWQRVQEMAKFIQQPPPTPNGRIVWQK